MTNEDHQMCWYHDNSHHCDSCEDEIDELECLDNKGLCDTCKEGQ